MAPSGWSSEADKNYQLQAARAKKPDTVQVHPIGEEAADNAAGAIKFILCFLGGCGVVGMGIWALSGGGSEPTPSEALNAVNKRDVVAGKYIPTPTSTWGVKVK